VGTGRFNSPDPSRASGGPGDPGSWNRYSYVQGDPVNFHDPSGLLQAAPDGIEGGDCVHLYVDGISYGCVGGGGGGGGAGGGGGGGFVCMGMWAAGLIPVPDPSCYAPGAGGDGDDGEDSGPHCSGDSHIENWITAHGADAATVAGSLGLKGNTGVADILGLSAIESGWGHPSFKNAFFGMHGPLPGEEDCVKAKGDPRVCVATFSSYLASAQAFAAREKGLIQGVTDPKQFATVLNGMVAKFGWGLLPNGKVGPLPNYIGGLTRTINAIADCLNILGR